MIFNDIDNFIHKCFSLQIFVGAVAVLTTVVVVLAHWIGLPYYWEKSATATVLLVIFGYWLLINVVFHYYMAASTSPGFPPEVDPMLFLPFISNKMNLPLFLCRNCMKLYAFVRNA